MKAFLVYWIIGTILVGIGTAAQIRRCPNDSIDPAKLVESVAVWPVAILVGVVVDVETRDCQRPAQ